MSEVKTRYVPFDNEHENQKWIVIEGYVNGVPQVTKRVTVAVNALVTRPALLEEARAKLVNDVTEYHANWLYLQTLQGP